MSQQYINVGTAPNDGLGDPIRTAFQKTNENFTELFSATGNISNVISVTGNGISVHGNITGNYFLGNGSQLTGIVTDYGNANVADYLPIYDGNLNPNTISAIGNITGNYIFGNGAFLTGISGGNGGGNSSSISNGSSNVSIPVADGNVLVVVDGTNNWTFGTDGTMYINNTISFADGDYIDSGLGEVQIWSDGGNHLYQFRADGDFRLPIATIPGSGDGDGGHLTTLSNLYVNANGFVTTFDESGNITTPGNIITGGPAGDITMDGGNINNVNVINLVAGGEAANSSIIQVANGYPTLYAYGSSGGHGGPEFDWSDTDSLSPDDFYGNADVYRNTMYINGAGLYVGINENSNSNIAPIKNSWQFNTDGTLYAGGNIIVNATGYAGPEQSITGNIYTGNLIMTSNITGSGASPAPSLNGFESVEAVNVSASGTVFTNNVVSPGGVLSFYANPTEPELVWAINNDGYPAGINNSAFVGPLSDDIHVGEIFLRATTGNAILTFAGPNNGVFSNAFSIISDGGNIIMATTPDGNTIHLSTFDTDGNLTVSNDLIGNTVYANLFVGNFQGNVVGNLVVNGSNTQVLYNNDGNAGASAGFTFDAASNTVSVNGLVSATGNVVGGNMLTSGVVSAGGNVRGSNINTTGIVSAAGNIYGSYIIGNLTGSVSNAAYATTAGTVTTNAQPNITSVGTLTSLSVTGNVDAGAFYTNTGNITTGAGVIKGPNVVVTHQLTFTGPYGNAVIDPYGNISTTGNVTASRFIGNGSQLTSLTGANVTGTVANATYATSAGSASTANTAGTVTSAAQTNITSLGTLTSLEVTTTNSNIITPGSTVVNNGFFKLPSYTSLEISHLTGMTGGEMVYNSTLQKVQAYQANATGSVTWVSLSVSTYQ